MAWKNLILLVSIAFTIQVSAQFTVVPIAASDCNTCDGGLTIQFPQTDDFSVSGSWNDIPFSEITGTDNAVSLENHCPGLFDITITFQGVSTNILIAVGTADAPSQNVEDVVCTTDQVQDLLAFFNPMPPAGGIWTDVDGNVISGMLDPETANSGVFIYTTDINSCDISFTLDLQINQPANPGSTTTYLICETYATFPLFDALFGNPDPGGTFYGPGFIEDDGFYDPLIDETTLFLYQIDSVQGCPPAFSTILVVENQLPYPGEDASISVCPDALPFDMFDFLGGNPDPGGNWYNAQNQVVAPVFDPLDMAPGTYTYRLTAATPCTPQSSQLTISFNQGISAGENASALFCSNDDEVEMTALLGGNPDSNGVWYNEQGDEVSSFFNPATSVPGIYTYLLQAVGCQDVSAELEMEVEYFPLAGNDVFTVLCGTQLISLSDYLTPDASAGGSWMNNLGINTGEIQSLQAGNSYQFTYEVLGTACPDDQSSISFVTELAPLAGADMELQICSTVNQIDFTSLFEASPGLNSEWFDQASNSINPVFSPQSAGEFDFYFVVNGSVNCPADTAVLTIFVEEPLFLNENAEVTLCSSGANVFPENYLPDGFPSGGTWQFNGQDLQFPVIDPDELPNGVYTYIVPQQGACPSPVFELLVTTSIQPDAGSDGILERCLNAAPILLSELPDSDANTNGIWLFNDEQLVGNSFTPASSGTLEYLVDAEWPCIPDIAEWEILVLPLPGFEAGNDINACSGTTSVQIGQDTNADWSFIWSPADNLDDPFSPDPSVTIVNEETQTTEITYTVTISDGICTATDALDITIFPLPEVVAGENVILCEGEQLTLNASGPEELSWSTEDWLEDLGSGQASIIAVESSWLVVTGLNEFGCPGTDSLFVEVRPAPELTVEIAPLSGCAPLETTLTHDSENEEGTFYYWIINDELSQNGNVLLQEPGTYSVTLVAVGTNGCSAQASFEESILVHPSPVAYFEHTPEQVDIYDQSISLNNLSSDADFWIWNFEGSSSEEWSPQFDILPVGGTYLEACLEVMNEFGCIDSICRYIEVLSDLGVFVPNAFSPNQDGRNESFYPVIHGYDTSDYLFQVYDRWGMLLFESKVPGEGWNGNYLTNSELVPPDIYVWQLFINSANEAKRFAQRGHVSIVR